MERTLNALHALIIAAVLLGAFGVQYFEHEEPCPLCFLQRLGMLGIAAGAMMNCRFGPKRFHYGLSLLFAIFGGFVALRQIALHVCHGFPAFGKPFWGLSLYTWSFIVFACSVAYIALLQIIFKQEESSDQSMNWFCHLVYYLIFGVAFANIITSLVLCGLGPCVD